MIFGNITQEKTYAFLPEDLKECFAYAKEHDLVSYEKGSHPIDGERLFVNVVEYETTRPENRFWEAHRNYLDVHLMLDLSLIHISSFSLQHPGCHRLYGPDGGAVPDL